MVKGSEARCIKFLLLLLNFLFLVAGVAGVALGVYSLLDKSQVNILGTVDASGVSGYIVTRGAIVVIVAGGVLVVISLLGCSAASKERKCLLALYIGFVILALIVECISGGLAAHFLTQGEDASREWLVEQVKVNYDGRGDTDRPFGQALDFAQVEFECCGINNYSDFKNFAAIWTERQSRQIPLACCKLNKSEFYRARLFIVTDNSCAINPNSTNAHIDNACFDKIRNHLRNQTIYLVVIAFISVATQMAGILLACCLIRMVKR